MQTRKPVPLVTSIQARGCHRDLALGLCLVYAYQKTPTQKLRPEAVARITTIKNIGQRIVSVQGIFSILMIV